MMGIESFYVKIKSEQIRNAENVLKTYEKYLDYSIEGGYCCVSGAIVSFFPAVELIYNICCAVKEDSFFIISKDQEICFNFKSYFDFLGCMYKIWEDKIRYFNKEWGAFIIKPSVYYKTRRKFQKKYYKKFD